MKLSTRYIVGDVFDVLARLPDASVDLVMTSPPFFALRSYLPAGHDDKARELGAEPTPAAYLDDLLQVVEACRRVLAPHGSLVFELGDTYAGSGGAGGDYGEGGIRAAQPAFEGSASRAKTDKAPSRVGDGHAIPNRHGRKMVGGKGWPLEKSLCGIPGAFALSLAYGWNVLNPDRETARWRVRNLIAWARPNPPVGALADKFRPATSYLTVAAMARDRWFDSGAVRVPHQDAAPKSAGSRRALNRLAPGNHTDDADEGYDLGAPLHDYWEISTQPYSGAHYATFPEEIPRRVILSMCPDRVCQTCGKPSRRIVDTEHVPNRSTNGPQSAERKHLAGGSSGFDVRADAVRSTVGWTDCGHNDWRTGVVLDPFAGSGTTLRMALGNGRSSIGIDLDARNADLARDRIGPLYLDIETREEKP